MNGKCYQPHPLALQATLSPPVQMDAFGKWYGRAGFRELVYLTPPLNEGEKGGGRNKITLSLRPTNLCGRGGIGIRAGLRNQCRKAYGFESLRPHSLE